MANPNMHRRRVPFAHEREVKDVDDALHERMDRRTQALRKGVIVPSNFFLLKHGERWQASTTTPHDNANATTSQTAEISIEFRRIIDHDLQCLEEFVSGVSDQMHGSFMRGMYAMVSETSARIGNVVSDSDFKSGFKKAIETVLFGVNKWGVPEGPELHIHPTMIDVIERYKSEADPVFEADMRRVRIKKEKEAMANEARRLSRFKF